MRIAHGNNQAAILTNTHGLRGNKLDNASVTRLDELGGIFERFTCSAIDLLDELGELASDVGGVAIEDGSVSSTDLTGVVENDDLSVEGSGFLGRVVLGVRADIATADILDGNVPVQKRLKNVQRHSKTTLT